MTRRGLDLQYRDGYIFAYGRDYKRGTGRFPGPVGRGADAAPTGLRGGSPPLCPVPGLVLPHDPPAALSGGRRVVDVLVVDTDFKSPNSWNGWNWNRQLFRKPAGFVDWAHRENMAVALNIPEHLW